MWNPLKFASFAAMVLLMVSGSSRAADAAGEVETKTEPWATITATKDVKVGEEVTVTVTFAKEIITEPTMLTVDMHWWKGRERAGVIGRFGQPKKLKPGDTGPFVFKKKVPVKDGISAIAAAVTLSPDGSWTKKTHTTSVGVRVRPADSPAPENKKEPNAKADPAADAAPKTDAAQTDAAKADATKADATKTDGGGASATGVSRLFILSGQSNMVGFNPGDTFVPRLEQAFPGDRIVVVKDAENGQAINRWRHDLGKGDLYLRLMKRVNETTAEQTFASTTFVWMQGESDAVAGKASDYEKRLGGLINQLRKDLKAPNMTVVIGRISDYKNGEEQWDTVRAVQVKVAEADRLAGWIDTDDLNGDDNNLHYRDKSARAELGRRFASKAAELIRKTRE